MQKIYIKMKFAAVAFALSVLASPTATAFVSSPAFRRSIPRESRTGILVVADNDNTDDELPDPAVLMEAMNGDRSLTSPSLAQTHMQGPLTVNGSGKALTREELEEVKKDLENIKAEYGLEEPVRSFMEDEDTKWIFGGPPDYSLTNYLYFKERTHIHEPGSLEQVVENLVKTWEMERSHKADFKQHKSVDPDRFTISANGGKVFNNKEANDVGNYNVLLDACPANIWDSANTSWEQSHDKFHEAFAAFPWEVLEVYSGPPKVAFTWRHWGTFTGSYEGNQGEGQLVEVFGFGTAVVNDKLQLCDVEIFYNAEEFISILRGEKDVDEVNADWNKGGSNCPFAAMLGNKSAEAATKK